MPTKPLHSIFGNWFRVAAIVSIIGASLAFSSPASAAPSFQLPMRGNVNVIGYVDFALMGNPSDHKGRDEYAADLYSDKPAVYPVGPGKVIWHAYDCPPVKGATSCYGNVVAIDHGNGYYSIYAHLACNDPFFTSLTDNEQVTTDTRIGTMSNSGIGLSTCKKPVTGNVHLHFAVRFSATSLDPKNKNDNTVLYSRSAVNIWQNPSAGGTTWMPGLPWPQASADYNSWGVSIGVNNAQPTVGYSVTLTAQATANAVDNSGNLLSQFQIDIKDSSGNVVGTCKASPCTTLVSQAAAGSQTYTAQIDYPEPFAIPTIVTMAPPNPGDPLPSTTVTWHVPSWSVAPPPPVGAIKMAAVNSTDIWTVDGGTINHWNGASWDTPVSVAGVLNGITALSSTDIWAVGYQAVGTSGLLQTLIMHYDGVNWTPVPSPNVGDRNNMLNAVTGEFSSTVWAAGNYIDDTGTSQPLIESWNGSGWSVATTPSPVNVGSAFTAIDMDLPNDIWAVGVGNTSPTTVQAPFVEHYDGTSWQIVPAPTVDPAHPWEFTGVTASAPNNVWAVGTTFNNPPAPPVPDLIEHWDGTSWQIVSTADPAAAQFSSLNDVSAASATDIWAAGNWVDASNITHTLIKHFDGNNWTVVNAPSPGAYSTRLNGIGALGDGTAAAVGVFSNSVNDVDSPLFLLDN